MSILRSWLLLVVACLVTCWSSAALAQDNPTKVGETPLAVVGLSRVNVAKPAERAFVLSGSANLAWFESMSSFYSDPDEEVGPTTRLQGILAASYSPLPEVTVGANVSGRLDFSKGEQTRAWGQPTLLARYVHEFSRYVGVGVQGNLLFEAGQAPSLVGVSPKFTGLVSVSPHPSTTIAGEVGYFFDTSKNNLDASPAEESKDTPEARILVEASDSPSVPWGLGVSQRLGSRGTELLLETSGRILVGKDAPKFMQSPWWISAGARHPLSESWSISASIEGALSSRPPQPVAGGEQYDAKPLQPFPPRIGGWLTVLYRPIFKKKFQGRMAIEGSLVPRGTESSETEQPAPPSSEVKGRIVDEGGRPLADVEVRLTLPDGSIVQERTYADGTFVFPGVLNEAETKLSVKTPGFDKVEVVLPAGSTRFQEVVLYPALPAGQVRGQVKTLKGDPIRAKITIDPTKQVVEAEQDGSFEFELAPGQYTISFEHEDYSTQRRVIVVQDRGVVILNIALTP